MTQHIFPKGDDLPLFTGQAYGPKDAPAFQPTDTPHQESLLDLRPVLGQPEPSYTPKDATHEQQ